MTTIWSIVAVGSIAFVMGYVSGFCRGEVEGWSDARAAARRLDGHE